MRFSKIKDNDIANGLGVTMSLWTQGCPHHCKGCFNGETWDFDAGEEFEDSDLEYILENINKNNVHRDLSILGGEPMHPNNIEGTTKLVKAFKEKYPNKNIWVWTGFLYDKDLKNKEVLNYIDVLVDGQYKDELHNPKLRWCGSSNQRVIDVKKSISENKIVLYEENLIGV